MKKIIIFYAIIGSSIYGMEQRCSFAKSVEQKSSQYVTAPRFLEDARRTKERISHQAAAETFIADFRSADKDQNKNTLSSDLSLPDNNVLTHDNESPASNEKDPSFINLSITVDNNRSSGHQKTNTQEIPTYDQIAQEKYFLAKNSRFLFGKPDMSKDNTMQRIKESFDTCNIAAMHQYLQCELDKFNNAAISDILLDRKDLYKISRRLSFILKHIENPVFQDLIAIYKADRLDDAKNARRHLEFQALQADNINVAGENAIHLDRQKKSSFLQVAHNLLEHRKDYQQEKKITHKSSRSPLDITNVITANQQANGGQQAIARKEQKASCDIDQYIASNKIIVEKNGTQLASKSPFDIDTIIELNRSNQNNVPANSLEKMTDAVTTTPSKIVNIHSEVDKRIEVALHELKTYSDFSEYMHAVGTKLDEMKQQGLLEVPVDVTQQAIAYGLQHFFKSMVPNNPLKNPSEFAVNAIKYTALGTLHTWTGGVLLPIQTAMMIGMKLQSLRFVDTTNMQPNDYAELVAEELADVAYTIGTAALMSKAKDTKIPEGFIKVGRDLIYGESSQAALAEGESLVQSMPTEQVEVKTSDGAKFKVSPEELEEGLHLQDNVNRHNNDFKNTPKIIKETKEAAKVIPDFIKEERVPLDRETILKDSSFKRTNKEYYDGAKIYEKDGKFYYRDKFHKGKGAHLEVFDKNGNHLGEADPLTGKIIPNTIDKTKNIKKLL